MLLSKRRVRSESKLFRLEICQRGVKQANVSVARWLVMTQKWPLGRWCFMVFPMSDLMRENWEVWPPSLFQIKTKKRNCLSRRCLPILAFFTLLAFFSCFSRSNALFWLDPCDNVDGIGRFVVGIASCTILVSDLIPPQYLALNNSTKWAVYLSKKPPQNLTKKNAHTHTHTKKSRIHPQKANNNQQPTSQPPTTNTQQPTSQPPTHNKPTTNHQPTNQPTKPTKPTTSLNDILKGQSQGCHLWKIDRFPGIAIRTDRLLTRCRVPNLDL